MASKGAGGSGSGGHGDEKGKGPASIWEEHGAGNENWGPPSRVITSEELDDDFCFKLTVIFKDRVSSMELFKFPATPPDFMVNGRSEKVQRAAESYWDKSLEASFLRRRIACLQLEGHDTTCDRVQLHRLQKSILKLVETLSTEIRDFEDVVINPKKQTERDSKKSKGKKRKG